MTTSVAPQCAPLSAPLALAGVQRVIEVGISITPTSSSAPAAAKALAAFLASAPQVPVRLAGFGSRGSRVVLTVAVTLGEVEDVKAASPSARAAVQLLQRIVDEFSAYEPAFTLLPDPDSDEARLAEGISTSQGGMAALLNTVGAPTPLLR